MTSGSGDRPRKEGSHGGGVYSFFPWMGPDLPAQHFVHGQMPGHIRFADRKRSTEGDISKAFEEVF